MPDAVNQLKDEGWGLSDKGFSQCIAEVGSDLGKLKEYLLDVCTPPHQPPLPHYIPLLFLHYHSLTSFIIHFHLTTPLVKL